MCVCVAYHKELGFSAGLIWFSVFFQNILMEKVANFCFQNVDIINDSDDAIARMISQMQEAAEVSKWLVARERHFVREANSKKIGDLLVWLVHCVSFTQVVKRDEGEKKWPISMVI